MVPTLEPGMLQVASAFPDPPFELEESGTVTGFDVELMRALCGALGLAYRPVKYAGDDFNRIFDGLAKRGYDAVISGITITPDRERLALFSEPYLEFNQGLAVNRVRTPEVRSRGDLRGQTVGIQVGNTSDIVAKTLLAEGAIADIRYYPYHGIGIALDDLSAGRIGALIKLFPVVSWLVKDRPELAVVEQIPTHEKLGIAVAPSNPQLRDAVDQALADLKRGRAFDALRRRWLGGQTLIS